MSSRAEVLTGTGCQNCTWHELPSVMRSPEQQGFVDRLTIDLHLASRFEKITFGIALNRRMVSRDIRDQGDIHRRIDLRLPQRDPMTQADQVTANAINPEGEWGELVLQVRVRRDGRFVGHSSPLGIPFRSVSKAGE